MNIKESLEFNNFVIIGNTINKEKYAYKIKSSILRANKNCFSIKENGNSLNEVPFDIDVLDLCINPKYGLEYLKDSKKTYKYVVIQPGAESDEIINYLKEHNIDYVLGCLLLAFKVYKGIEVENND